ncbi:PH domain-containing protein [Aliidiomarina celeris]|uniref:PH domain-containing protein n=1 Tax=Aliidiomarina celeris TaxID=2249428 RepID=UPI0018E645A2|nr:PH domain-containing protein [Aliidiomarina celeris]
MMNENNRNLTRVDERYRYFLQIQVCIPLLLLGVVLFVFWLWVPRIPDAFSLYGGAAVLLLLVIGVFIWAPRRSRVTAYYVEDDLIGFIVGALWHKEVVVPFNRLQHLELQQGPTERLLGLSRLVLYTAGGTGADLAIPGLRTETAEQIRDQVLGIVRSEVLEDEAITQANDASEARHD